MILLFLCFHSLVSKKRSRKCYFRIVSRKHVKIRLPTTTAPKTTTFSSMRWTWSTCWHVWCYWVTWYCKNKSIMSIPATCLRSLWLRSGSSHVLFLRKPRWACLRDLPGQCLHHSALLSTLQSLTHWFPPGRKRLCQTRKNENPHILMGVRKDVHPATSFRHQAVKIFFGSRFKEYSDCLASYSVRVLLFNLYHR